MVKKGNDSGFSTAFSVAPGIWLTCKHVVAPYEQYKVEVPLSNAHDFATWPTRQPLTLKQNTAQDESYFHHLVRDDKEPLYGLDKINAEFTATEYFDVALLSGPIVGPLYPSVAPLNPSERVAVFGFNGVPVYETISRDFDFVYGNSPLKPTLPYANNLFHHIGSKGVSFGSILATRPGLLTHNCSLLNGASGSFLVKVDGDGLAFVGLHTGGDFNNVTNTAYNYGYHTSHVGLVLLYAKFLYPIFKAHGPIPEPILAYLKHHKTTIEEHREFVDNDIFATVLI